MTGFPRAAVLLAVALLTLLAFAPVLQNGFVDWDDDINLVRNDHFRGLGGEQLRWMFTTTLTGHYIPFTWLSFGVDYQVWGMRPVGYHLTSLLLHALGAALLAGLTARLLRRATAWSARAITVASAVAALVFAVHPLRVESVAWATERRDVLSGVFVLLTVLAYVTAADARTSERRRRWLLTGSVVAYVLALGSKSIAMALPIVLLALDAYPLRRTHEGWLRLVREKLPFLVLAAVSAVVAFQAVAGAAVLTPLTQYPWPARVAMGAYSLVWTVEKIAMPLSLSPLYQLPVAIDPLSTPFASRMVALVIITAVLIVLRRRWPAGLVAWTCHAAFLLPVSGLLVHQGPQLVTDRYSYLPSLGWAVLAGAGAGWLVTAAERTLMSPAVARFVTAALAISLAALATLSWQQSKVWHDTDTLWRHAIALDSECATCHANLGVYHMNVGHAGAAELHLMRAVALRPDRARYHANLGLFLVQQGRYADALPQLQDAVERAPDYVDALTGLGAALINLKRTEAALPFLERAVALRPDHVLARTNLGAGLMEMDRPSDAVEQYRRAVAADAAASPPRAGLVRAYLALGRLDLAREQYGIVLRLDPRLARPLAAAVLE
jgi:protein O-mannosyl-transferase